MDNPFESGHIKNYILLYASVVVIMILFFIATTLFHDNEVIKKKEFNTKIEEKPIQKTEEKEAVKKPKFKLMDSTY